MLGIHNKKPDLVSNRGESLFYLYKEINGNISNIYS